MNLCIVFQPFFAFSLKEDYEVNGWEVYDCDKEFERLVKYCFLFLYFVPQSSL